MPPNQRFVFYLALVSFAILCLLFALCYYFELSWFKYVLAIIHAPFVEKEIDLGDFNFLALLSGIALCILFAVGACFRISNFAARMTMIYLVLIGFAASLYR